mmetsp:Transcript_33968/g.95508  ORF Transcript_33968/g.95508 Transcript_33968/m.95508 type:complete len:501 (+) Transcript_33968:977-2479(+)
MELEVQAADGGGLPQRGVREAARELGAEALPGPRVPVPRRGLLERHCVRGHEAGADAAPRGRHFPVRPLQQRGRGAVGGGPRGVRAAAVQRLQRLRGAQDRLRGPRGEAAAPPEEGHPGAPATVLPDAPRRAQAVPHGPGAVRQQVRRAAAPGVDGEPAPEPRPRTGRAQEEAEEERPEARLGGGERGGAAQQPRAPRAVRARGLPPTSRMLALREARPEGAPGPPGRHKDRVRRVPAAGGGPGAARARPGGHVPPGFPPARGRRGDPLLHHREPAQHPGPAPEDTRGGAVRGDRRDPGDARERVPQRDRPLRHTARAAAGRALFPGRHRRGRLPGERGGDHGHDADHREHPPGLWQLQGRPRGAVCGHDRALAADAQAHHPPGWHGFLRGGAGDTDVPHLLRALAHTGSAVGPVPAGLPVRLRPRDGLPPPARGAGGRLGAGLHLEHHRPGGELHLPRAAGSLPHRRLGGGGPPVPRDGLQHVQEGPPHAGRGFRGRLR